jgi:hypothetical protein
VVDNGVEMNIMSYIGECERTKLMESTQRNSRRQYERRTKNERETKKRLDRNCGYVTVTCIIHEWRKIKETA